MSPPLPTPPLPQGPTTATGAITRTLDDAALAHLRGLDPSGGDGVMQRILHAFEASLARMVAQLAAERDSGNSAPVVYVAHTLKSSSASVGALHLAAACTEVDKRLRVAAEGAAADPAGAAADQAAERARLRADIEYLHREGEAALAAVRAMLPT